MYKNKQQNSPGRPKGPELESGKEELVLVWLDQVWTIYQWKQWQVYHACQLQPGKDNWTFLSLLNPLLLPFNVEIKLVPRGRPSKRIQLPPAKLSKFNIMIHIFFHVYWGCAQPLINMIRKYEFILSSEKWKLVEHCESILELWSIKPFKNLNIESLC